MPWNCQTPCYTTYQTNKQEPSGAIQSVPWQRGRVPLAQVLQGSTYPRSSQFYRGDTKAFPTSGLAYIGNKLRKCAQRLTHLLCSLPMQHQQPPQCNTSSPECAGHVAVLRPTCTQPPLLPRGNTCKASHQSSHSQTPTKFCLQCRPSIRYVRHPGYLGWYVWCIGTQLLLVNPLSCIAFAYVVSSCA